MKKIIILCPVILFSVFTAKAGDTLVKNGSDFLELKGKVLLSQGQQRDEDKTVLDSAVISVKNESGLIVLSQLSDVKGKVDLRLPLNRKFTVSITKPGFICKIISVDTKVGKAFIQNYSFAFDVDIFEKVDGLDVSVLDQPVAKISFNSISHEFSYDIAYTSKVNAGLQKMYREYYVLKRREIVLNDSVPSSKPTASRSAGTKKSVPYGKNNKPK
ncbi:MAG: hypothetical protein HY064_00755 [Bacteroidetes bacterium]|nr:hypothetical protein [Bacteroidota bacterium]